VPASSLLAFLLAAGLLTVTPGLDTALVLRTATVEGARRALLATVGITLGCLVWGAAVALGLAALLTASRLAYTLLTWAGAAYLLWLGLLLLLRPRDSMGSAAPAAGAGGGATWFLRGLLGNLLNPKIGVFYVSFLPQFVPAGTAPGPYIFFLAMLHVGLGLLWYAVLILATTPLNRALRRAATIRALDRLTGTAFIAFGVKLALSRD
jgi:threonine/homoserine/homoserine lactone efflux protein